MTDRESKTIAQNINLLASSMQHDVEGELNSTIKLLGDVEVSE